MKVGDWVKLTPEVLQNFKRIFTEPKYEGFWEKQHQIIAIRGDPESEWANMVFRYPKSIQRGTEYNIPKRSLVFVRNGTPPKCGWHGCTVEGCTMIPIPPRGEHDDEDDDFCPDCGEHVDDCDCDDRDDYFEDEEEEEEELEEEDEEDDDDE